jgi:hypothetical protein
MKIQIAGLDPNSGAPPLPGPLTGARTKTGKTNLARRILPGVLACSVSFAALGQYSIDWYKVSNGGGTSAAGTYSLSGTIGQHDAGGPMQGGAFSLTGGYWALSAIQTLGAPVLTIFLTPTNTAVVSWVSPSTGFSLQQNTNLNTTNWATPSQTVNDNGVTRFILVNPPTGSRFYRLHHP